MATTTSTSEALWQGHDDALSKALASAQEQEDGGNAVSANSIRLSAYITTIDDPTTVDPSLVANANHAAAFLKSHAEELSHNQLDVLLGWYLKLPAGNEEEVYELLKLADREVMRAKSYSTATHQIALAYTTRARLFLRSSNTKHARIDAEVAASYEKDMCAEENRQFGLRQLSRVLHYIGLIMDQTGGGGLPYLEKALALAEGEADAPPQAEAIRNTIQNRHTS